MAKKFLIFITIVLILSGGFGIYTALKDRRQTRQIKAVEKLPETTITLLEGWTNDEMGDYLEKNQIMSKANFLASLSKFDTKNYPLTSIKPKNSDLQGFIFPDTYFIPKTPKSTDDIGQIIIKKALDNFSNKITSDMLAKADTDGMDLYKILTLASIIEKETGREAITPEQKNSLDQERKTIAGIFYNRLNLGMPFQSDATVNFVTKKNAPSPSLADTEVDSPYNTYKYKGLPPGPICNPSLSSINAALDPINTDFLYFLHDQKTGQVFYASTYEEHLKNKQKYLQ